MDLIGKGSKNVITSPRSDGATFSLALLVLLMAAAPFAYFFNRV